MPIVSRIASRPVDGIERDVVVHRVVAEEVDEPSSRSPSVTWSQKSLTISTVRCHGYLTVVVVCGQDRLRRVHASALSWRIAGAGRRRRTPSAPAGSRAACGMPSMCGQSDPKITRSAPMHSTTSLTSSSQNGLIQMLLLERLDRVLVEEHRHLVARRTQLAEHVGQELGAVLDRRDPDVREPAEEVVEHERREEVVDRPLELHERDRRPRPAALGVRLAAERAAGSRSRTPRRLAEARSRSCRGRSRSTSSRCRPRARRR